MPDGVLKLPMFRQHEREVRRAHAKPEREFGEELIAARRRDESPAAGIERIHFGADIGIDREIFRRHLVVHIRERDEEGEFGIECSAARRIPDLPCPSLVCQFLPSCGTFCAIFARFHPPQTRALREARPAFAAGMDFDMAKIGCLSPRLK